MPTARLGGISLDCSDTRELADFYRELLGLELAMESDEFVALKGSGLYVTTQKVDDYQAPDWPDNATPKQLHLELSVTDLDEAEAAAIGLGATKASSQPSPDHWRVLIDPAGHPFCITTLIPDD
jgi:catechol 2,3-dioxygenase-like lactoylglutathione lyase family enzyme